MESELVSPFEDKFLASYLHQTPVPTIIPALETHVSSFFCLIKTIEKFIEILYSLVILRITLSLTIEQDFYQLYPIMGLRYHSL